MATTARALVDRRSFLSSTAAALAALACPRLAHGENRWHAQLQYGPFRCFADFDLTETKPLLAELGELQTELVRTLGVRRARTPIELYLFAQQAQHQQHLAAEFPRVPYRRALFVKRGSRMQVFAYRHADLVIDLRHEGTHALLHASQPFVPLWLDEGLAEYFEVAPDQRAFGNPHLDELRWNMRLGMIPTLASLEQMTEIEDMQGFEYRYAWAWAHFMLHGPVEAHRALVAFLADGRAGKPAGLLSQRLGQSIDDVETELVRHFKYWKQQPG